MRLPSAYNKTREWILQIAENPSAEVEKLPAERQICSILNVSRDTVRRVIASFVEEGILEVRHGNGTYLNASAIRRHRKQLQPAGFSVGVIFYAGSASVALDTYVWGILQSVINTLSAANVRIQLLNIRAHGVLAVSEIAAQGVAGVIWLCPDREQLEVISGLREKEIPVVTIGGTCKGAGMIAPKMAVPHATMLCYITTDCVISNRQLSAMLGEVVDDSFNKVTVDGDMSTNDTVIVMANGASGAEIREGSIDELHFKTALTMVAQHLARSIAMDGEGATKFVSVEVSGAANNSEAELCARTVANSLLCKTAWFGCDPNWGRVLAAAGRSGANFSAENVSLDYDEMPVVRNGMDAGVPEAELARVLKRGEFTIKLNLGEGHGSFTVWTSDVSYEYVKINADYHS